MRGIGRAMHAIRSLGRGRGINITLVSIQLYDLFRCLDVSASTCTNQRTPCTRTHFQPKWCRVGRRSLGGRDTTDLV